MELINFYSFIFVSDPTSFGKDFYHFALDLDLKGTILVAPEGMNIALTGEKEKLDSFLEKKIAVHTKLEPSFLRRCLLQKPAYRKLKLKIKEELVCSRFPKTKEINLGSSHLTPEEFQNWLERDDILLVDMRNDYEYAIGSFQGALHLPLNEFSQLPSRYTQLIEDSLDLRKHTQDELPKKKKIVTFCTGGVRCEKAVPFLKSRGFDAYQLKGGILHYLEKYGQKKENRWVGECFVFDNRVAVNTSLAQGSYVWCEHCGQPNKDGICVICG